MNRVPRLLPLVAVAIGGVLAVNALAGARSLPDLVSNARAFAEETVAKKEPAKAEKPAAPVKAQSAIPTGPIIGAAAIPPPAPICAPTAGELAREAGLSPAELQMLQSLQARRAQIEQRERDLDVQMKLLAAAEAKLDAKIASLNALRGDIQGLIGQADAASQAETTRLVRVYEAMKPKDAAARMTILSDPVRLPIAAKMKERSLSTVLGFMPAPAAKELTEKLAQRFASAAPINQARAAVAARVAPAAAAKPAPPAKPPAQAAVPAPKPKPA